MLVYDLVFLINEPKTLKVISVQIFYLRILIYYNHCKWFHESSTTIQISWHKYKVKLLISELDTDMSLHWTLIAGFLYAEIAFIALLLLPFISNKTWHKVKYACVCHEHFIVRGGGIGGNFLVYDFWTPAPPLLSVLNMDLICKTWI